MAAPLKHDWPEDGAMVALFALHGSRAKVAQAIGIHETVLRAYLSRAKRSALRATCEAVQPKRPASAYRPPGSYTTNYPTDEEMVALMAAHRSFSAVARAVGVRRESLRDYLRRRPSLDAAMREHQNQRQRKCVATRAPEVRFRPQSWVAPKWRRAWVRRHADSADTAEQYAAIIERDPCVYCGARCEEIDHIEPVSCGGSGDYGNLAPSCRHCNRAKNARPFLYHMLRRAEGWA